VVSELRLGKSSWNGSSWKSSSRVRDSGTARRPYGLSVSVGFLVVGSLAGGPFTKASDPTSGGFSIWDLLAALYRYFSVEYSLSLCHSFLCTLGWSTNLIGPGACAPDEGFLTAFAVFLLEVRIAVLGFDDFLGAVVVESVAGREPVLAEAIVASRDAAVDLETSGTASCTLLP
jgi:hypothetical protein